MKRLAALLAIAGAMFLTSAAGAREPTQIKTCQKISQPGSYELVNNLVATGDCLVITADFVTIDLAGFSIEEGGTGRTGILALPSSGELRGIAVRNGSISSSGVGVDLHSALGSIVEGLRVVATGSPGVAIIANGIVKGNIAFGGGVGTNFTVSAMAATGIVTGNYVIGGRNNGLAIGQGSTVIGNTVTGAFHVGLFVNCPSNVSNNTAVNNGTFGTGGPPSPGGANLVLNGDGCRSEDNVAP